MSILKLTDNLYIAPQLTQADTAEAARLGIRSVICNHPDGEEPGQPDFAQVQQWLAAQGIDDMQPQPLVAASLQVGDVARFKALRQSSHTPVLAYCRTGTRCSLLWGLDQAAAGMPVAEIIAAAGQAGVDLGNFTERLQAAAHTDSNKPL